MGGFPRLPGNSRVDIKLCAFIRKLSVLGLLLLESLKANRWLTWPKREPMGVLTEANAPCAVRGVVARARVFIKNAQVLSGHVHR